MTQHNLETGFLELGHNDRDTNELRCELCGRNKPLSFHHLIPKKNHSNKWFKKNFSRQDMQTRGIQVCRKCHNMIHKTFSEKVLGREYNTLQALESHPKVQDFVKWVSKQS